MNDFPAFMKNPANRIAASDQVTPGVEGYVFDGADGSQMAFWTCAQTALCAAHSHEFDEYMLVVQEGQPWMGDVSGDAPDALHAHESHRC